MEQNSRNITSAEFKDVQNLFNANQQQLLLYSELLLWWNSKVNLVSRGVSREAIVEHIKHSLYVSLFDDFKNTESILDTGSGGGLPAIPLALCYSEKTFLINDIVTKKIFAVKDMVNKLGLRDRVRAEAKDIKAVALSNELIITKHAFKIDQLSDFLQDKNWNTIVFLKGYKEAEEEFEKLDSNNYSLEIIKLEGPFMPYFYKGKGVVKLVKKNEQL